MKKVIILSAASMLLLSSCGSYEASGAYTGGHFGSILGSAIGGIAGGPRGSDIGTIVGMAGGAVVGGAIGKSADKKAERAYEERMQQRVQQRENQRYGNSYDYTDDSGFDPNNGGDDRISFGNETVPSPSFSAPQSLEIRHAKLIDENHDGVLSRGETARMVFEIYNHSSQPVYRVLPCVDEVTGNRHVFVSQNVLVESIQPHHGIRYTATIKGGHRLKAGRAVLRVGVMQSGTEVSSQTREIVVSTGK